MSKQLVIYLMAMPDTPELVQAAVDAGADIIEIGFPFSDPLADGPVIRRAGERALAAGMRTKRCLEVLAEIRARVDVPLIPMTYASIFDAYGWERLETDARSAGATSFIVPDLPADVHPELRRVQLVAPTSTDARLKIAADATDGWLYLVTVTGTTGARTDLAPSLAPLAERVRARHRRSAVRRLRHLDAGACARGRRARRRDRRRLARRRSRRGRSRGARPVRGLAAQRVGRGRGGIASVDGALSARAGRRRCLGRDCTAGFERQCRLHQGRRLHDRLRHVREHRSGR